MQAKTAPTSAPRTPRTASPLPIFVGASFHSASQDRTPWRNLSSHKKVQRKPAKQRSSAHLFLCKRMFPNGVHSISATTFKKLIANVGSLEIRMTGRGSQRRHIVELQESEITAFDNRQPQYLQSLSAVVTWTSYAITFHNGGSGASEGLLMCTCHMSCLSFFLSSICSLTLFIVKPLSFTFPHTMFLQRFRFLRLLNIGTDFTAHVSVFEPSDGTNRPVQHGHTAFGKTLARLHTAKKGPIALESSMLGDCCEG